MRFWQSYHDWRRRVALCLIIMMVILIGVNILLPPPIKAARHVSSVAIDAKGRMLSSFTVEDGTWRLPAKLSGIDQRFIDRLIAIEDKRFNVHSGVDFPAVLRAARSWHREGKVVSGASTLTMQLVRQLEPRPRTFLSKSIEILRAIQIELWMDKDEILEAYLSHVPYGGNIEGIEAATRLYFDKSPEYLTDGEIALLISLPQAPEARRPDRRVVAATAGRNSILDKLQVKGAMTAQAVIEAKETPIPLRRHEMSDTAWITAYGLTEKYKGEVQVTLDAGMQIELESLVKTFVDDFPQAVNIALIVVENDTMAVRAHIASADRARPGGWIDMTSRPRSPGSTLKPFIYGLAIDEGLMSSGSMVFDAPTRFGAYRPENFNRRYHGNVRIDEALRYSLNVPAVAALDLIGGDHFEQSLSQAGVKVSRTGGSEKAGLALALGGAGLTVNDVALLYAALANGGQAQSLKWSPDDMQSNVYPLMSAQSASEIKKMLTQAPTPEGHIPAWLTKGAAKIAYKTGTSYGFRDAWAAGYTDDFTVVVWVGRPDGAPRIGTTGRLAAAPLLFDVFERLTTSSRQAVYRKDDDAPAGLQKLGGSEETAPHILFPPSGTELYTDTSSAASRGFTISARTIDGEYSAYVNGRLLSRRGRHTVWRPRAAGFYTVRVVDKNGEQAISQVRVLSSQSLSAHSLHKGVETQ